MRSLSVNAQQIAASCSIPEGGPILRVSRRSHSRDFQRMKGVIPFVLFCLATCVIIEVGSRLIAEWQIPVGEKRCIYDEMAVGHKPQLYVNVVDGGKHDIHFTVVYSLFREK